MHINKNIAISESGFIFNPATGDSFSANSIGQDIIRLLQSEKSIEVVIQSVHEKYSIDKSTLEKDMSDFLYILKTYQIIKDEEQA
ncbi:MAG: PqqD family protein [Bacteroidetes bacterium]|nr:PqqD family protein [Bacteroidota bacterium]